MRNSCCYFLITRSGSERPPSPLPTGQPACKKQQQAGFKMATRNKLITFEEAATRIGVLPTLFPPPNAKNIRIFCKALIEVLQSVPSYVPIPTFWAHGIRNDARRVCINQGAAVERLFRPWIPLTPRRNAPQQRDLDVTFVVASNIFQNQETFGKQLIRP